MPERHDEAVAEAERLRLDKLAALVAERFPPVLDLKRKTVRPPSAPETATERQAFLASL